MTTRYQVRRSETINYHDGSTSGTDRITLYDVPNLVTPGDIRRAIADKTQGIINGTLTQFYSKLCIRFIPLCTVQIDYKAFRPSGKAMLTVENPEHLAGNLRALQSLFICGVKVRPVAHYSPESWMSRPEDPEEEVTGNGPEGNFPHVERSVVIWGLPGKTAVHDVAMALSGFKVEQKEGKPIIAKLPMCVNSFLRVETGFILISPSSKAARELYTVFAICHHNGFGF